MWCSCWLIFVFFILFWLFCANFNLCVLILNNFVYLCSTLWDWCSTLCHSKHHHHISYPLKFPLPVKYFRTQITVPLTSSLLQKFLHYMCWHATGLSMLTENNFGILCVNLITSMLVCLRNSKFFPIDVLLVVSYKSFGEFL